MPEGWRGEAVREDKTVTDKSERQEDAFVIMEGIKTEKRVKPRYTELKKYPGKPWPLGVSKMGNGRINFAFLREDAAPFSVRVYQKRKVLGEFDFTENDCYGQVFCLQLDGLQETEFTYELKCRRFSESGEDISAEVYAADPYAAVVYGNEIWGKTNSPHYRFGMDRDSYDWEADRPLKLPEKDLLIYQLHPRGFTRHRSSGVAGKGTFAGIKGKIPYLNELGITAVELLPSYEFQEREDELPVNYWGYKEGFYFAPKASYCASKHPAQEFRDLVKELHRAGIEVILQFWFAQNSDPSFVASVLRFWAVEYHVDGFRLIGAWLPAEQLRRDPVLTDRRIFYEDMDREEFRLAVRRFLRGEEWALPHFLGEFQSRYADGGIHDITDYSGFSLADLVSYEQKHNEANGEENRDGDAYQVSWNCGIEGETDDPGIRKLRMGQMKNAFAYLMLSQSVPRIVAGDEFGFSHGGNNNPYCQDNEINWLDWKLEEHNAQLLSWVRELIAFRKKTQLIPFEQDQPVVKKGYPHLSFHGTQAWNLNIRGGQRHAGVMLCGLRHYEDAMHSGQTQEASGMEAPESEEYIYLACNQDREAQFLALPNLPEGMVWNVWLDSADGSTGYGNTVRGIREEIGRIIEVSPYSVRVLTACKKSAFT